MRTIAFLQPRVLTFGNGCQQDAVAYLQATPLKRIHIVGSPSLAHPIEDLSEQLRRARCTVTTQYSSRAEPTIRDFSAALDRARDAKRRKDAKRRSDAD